MGWMTNLPKPTKQPLAWVWTWLSFSVLVLLWAVVMLGVITCTTAYELSSRLVGTFSGKRASPEHDP